MSESRAVPSGEVYRQLFEAQVQLSRSLLAGRKDTRTDCLSAEDSNTHCSTTSSRRQQVDEDDDLTDDVSRLPDTVVVDRPPSDIIERLSEKRTQKQEAAGRLLSESLSALSEVCEVEVRTAGQQLLSCLQAADHRLDVLRVRMEALEHVSLQEVHSLWQEVEEEVKLKASRLMELNTELRESERRRTDEIRALLKRHCHLLEEAGLLPPADIHRLLHSEATTLNQSLLVNRRSAARLLLRLREDTLQQESLLRRHWEERLSCWKRSRMGQVVDSFRRLCSADQGLDQDQDQELVTVQQNLTEKRNDIILKMSSLVPPTCSAAVVSDWFDLLTANNEQIECCHADLLHRWRCGLDRRFQDWLTEVERCKVALSALQVTEEEINDVIDSQLLPLIGRQQADNEQRLAAFDVCGDLAARHALRLSRGAFAVMRAAASLWATHRRRLERTEDELLRRLDDRRRSQQQRIQKKKACVDDLLGALRQEGSEEALQMSLEKTFRHLQDVKESYTQCVCDQWEVLDRLPSLLMEELLSYSRSLCSFFSLSHAYQLSPEEVQKLHPPLTASTTQDRDSDSDVSRATGAPISYRKDSDHTHTSEDRLTEAKSSLLEFYDTTSSDDAFISSGGVVCTGPAFKCPQLPDNLQQQTQLSLFPVELLTHTLSRTRTLFLEHLDQHFRDTLKSAVAMVTERKEAVVSEQELQLQHLNAQHIQTHIYQPRLAELQLHRQRVDHHCNSVQDVQTSCRTELLELQSAISRKNQELSVTLSNMEAGVQTSTSSRGLQALSSALQGCVDEHVRDTQRCQSAFRRSVQVRLQEVRDRTTQLLGSFRLFSEGGHFAPQEMKTFQRRLKEVARQIGVTEDAVLSELEVFESRSLQQVKEASAHLDEKVAAMRSEAAFADEVQQMMSSLRVRIRAETNSSDQQQTEISIKLQELKRMLESTQVSPHQVCPLVSSVSEDVGNRCRYLDLDLESALQESLALSRPSESRVLLPPGPPSGVLQASCRGADLLDDPVVGVVHSLNRFGSDQETAADGQGRATASGSSPVQPQQRSIKSVSAASVRGGRGSCRSLRAERRFPVFGNRPEVDLNSNSFSSSLIAMLTSTDLALLQAAEEFYRRERHSRLQLLPDSLDQWTDSVQQRLLGYQEEAGKVLSASRKEVVQQISVLDQLLDLVPAVLIRNQEQQQEAGLRQEVGRVMQRLMETLTASEKEKDLNVLSLRVSLTREDLQTLHCREELRQQRLHSATCSAHLELQECVQARGEEFVTSLDSLTEKLLPLVDVLLTPSGGSSSNHATQEATEDTRVCLKAAGTPVAEATTASIINFKQAEKRLTITEERNTAKKRFEQLVSSELSRSDDDKRRQLNQQQSWNTHWNQQIHTLKHTIQQ